MKKTRTGRKIARTGLSFLVSATLALGLCPAAAFAAVGETAAGDEVPAAAKVLTLAPENGIDDVTAMAIGGTYDVDVALGEFWVGSFTASAAGDYVFYSEGNYDTYGYLYSDASLEDQLRSDDDNGNDSNFSIEYSLTAGQTVYLKAQEYGQHAATFTVSVKAIDPNDISLSSWNIYWNGSSNFVYGNPIELSNLRVCKYIDGENDITLTVGNGLRAAYYLDDDGNRLDQAPTNVGYYQVAVEGTGSYSGMRTIGFSIVDPTDISSGYWYSGWSDGDQFEYTGSPIVPPAAQIYRWDSASDSNIYLTEDTDFRLAYYKNNNDVRLDQAPVNPGYYYAVYEGIGSYHGARNIGFRITGDPYDLSFATFNTNGSLFTYTGNPVDIEIYNVYGTNGNWLDEEEYTVVYYDAQGGELSSAPSAPGDYSVALRAAAGTDYKNETAPVAFAIMSENDLRNDKFSCSWVGSSRLLPNPAGVTLPEIHIFYWDDDDDENVYLTPGTDYALDYYEAEDGTKLDKAPSEIGEYYAVYRGEGNYSGFIKAYFKICDPADFNNFSIEFEDNDIPLLNGSAVPTVTVIDVTGKTVASSNYELQYCPEDDGYDDFTVAAPTAPGDYYVRAVAKAGNAGGYNGATGGYYFSVYDPYDLSRASLSLESYDIPLPQSGPAVPAVTVTDSLGKMVAPSNYELRYRVEDDYDADYTATAPTAPGDYYVRAYAKAGNAGGYSGSTGAHEFTVYDPYDLRNVRWSGSFWPSSSIAYTGAAVVLPTSLIYQWEDDDYYDETRVRLTEGKDYKLAYYTDDEGNKLSQAPSAVGNYHAVYEGIYPYKGTISLWFGIYDTHSISGGGYWTSRFPSGSTFYTDGDPIVLPTLTVYSNQGKQTLTEGKEYQFDRFEKLVGEYGGSPKIVDLGKAAPSENGSYNAVYTAIPGSGYEGTLKARFYINNSRDLQNGELRLAATRYAYTGNPISVNAKVYDSDGMRLEEGKDYKFVFFADGTEIPGAPKEKGDYGVAAKAVEGGFYVSETPTELITIGDGGGSVAPDPTQGGKMELDTPYDVTVASGGSWVGSFTAPEDGAYVFESTSKSGNSYDTYGHLYADAGLTNEIARNDDGGNGANFSIVQAMKAGQTVYLKAREYGNGAMTCFVSVSKLDATQLRYATLTRADDDLIITGASIDPQITVVDAAGNTLTAGKDYTLVYYSDETGQKITTALPSEPGRYRAQAVEVNGGAYKGESNSLNFTVYSPFDLSRATFSLESSRLTYTGNPVKPVVTVTDVAGATLTEGTDYELVYHQSIYGDYELIATAPTEPGSYRVAARAKSGGKYTGKTGVRYFTVVDPKDISQCDSVSLSGASYEKNVGYDTLPVYLYAGKNVEPEANVWIDDELLTAGTDYTVTYANNGKPAAGVFAKATATLTGKSPYKGTITREFLVVSPLDLGDMVANGNCYLMARGSSRTINRYSEQVTFLADGASFALNVNFNSRIGGVVPVQGVDFTVKYTDVNGKEIAPPKDPGKYRAVLTPTATGVCTGTASIRFAIVNVRDIARYGSLTLSNSSSFALTRDSGAYWVYDTAVKAADFIWTLSDNAKKLAENLDYAVTVTEEMKTVGGKVWKAFNFLFAGENSYEGERSATVYVATTPQDSLDGRTVMTEDGDALGTVDENTIYLGKDGALGQANLLVQGLVAGIDYEVSGYTDAAGKAVTKAKNGDAVYATITGKGAYAGTKRTVGATVSVAASGNPVDITDADFRLDNGLSVYDAAARKMHWYLLSSEEPEVALSVHDGDDGRFTLWAEDGFTVSKKVNAGGATATLTMTAKAGSQVKGSTTATINLVNKYDLSKFIVGVYVTGDGSGDNYQFEPGDVANLKYVGAPYEPTITYHSTQRVVNPDVKTTLAKAGKEVARIDGVGSYTLTVTGTDDWAGKLTVPIEVTELTSLIDLSQCSMRLTGSTALVSGAAKPTVDLTFGSYKLVEGKDYKLEYGANTTNGSHAWVKAVAVDGGKFAGIAQASFTVGEAAKPLTRAGYDLQLLDPAGERYISVPAMDGYTLTAGAKVGPAVRVMIKSADGTRTVLDPSNYTVAYGNLSKPGLGYVTVTGKGAYSGSLSGNFLIEEVTSGSTPMPEKETQTITAANKAVQVGKTVALDAVANGGGALTYSSSNTGVATVDANGVVTGIKAGTATITINAAETATYKAASVTVAITVSADAPKPTTKNDQAITAADATVQVGKTVALGAVASGGGALTYATSDATVATVDAKGVVTGKKAGTAKITIKAAATATYNAATMTVNVTVTAPPEKLAQTITAANKTVQVKKTVKLDAKASGGGALTYESSNTKVATVNAKGVVTGKKAGTAKITITAAATATHKTATKTVTVTVKSANKLATKSAKATVSYSKVKKKAQVFTPKVIKTKGTGKTTYKIKSVTKKFKKYVTVSSSGKVTIKKGAPKGSCSLVLNVTAAGSSKVMKVTKTAKVTIKVK